VFSQHLLVSPMATAARPLSLAAPCSVRRPESTPSTKGSDSGSALSSIGPRGVSCQPASPQATGAGDWGRGERAAGIKLCDQAGRDQQRRGGLRVTAEWRVGDVREGRPSEPSVQKDDQGFLKFNGVLGPRGLRRAKGVAPEEQASVIWFQTGQLDGTRMRSGALTSPTPHGCSHRRDQPN